MEVQYCRRRLLNPSGLALFKLYPNPNRSGSANNYTNSPKRTQFAFTTDGRVDHQFGPNDSMFARYSYNNASTLTPGDLAGGERHPAWREVSGFEGTADETAQNFLLDYTHIFKPTLLLELKAGYTRFVNDYVTLNEGKNVSEQLGIPNINVNSTTTGLTDIYPVGYASLGESTFEPNLADLQYISICGYCFLFNAGNHSIKGGLSLIRRQLNNVGAGY